MTPTDLRHLSRAIALARSAREHGNHPFGALLVGGGATDVGEVLCEAENSVVTTGDVTGHAETNLVRIACARVGSAARSTSTLYTSTEPCAMCAGAIHWAGIGRIVFALSEADLYDLVGPSPEHLRLPCRHLFSHTARTVLIEGPAAELDAEARAVHAGFWR
jgi:tRNA(Arg) A34 adenosine deaminase TadA